ncbi:hypothetical protein [Nocardioides ungokensis]|uniref:hypothetical protein n=1 Tax=Nocardioides ungokensis TaxID=1643322 RepID=UPI0015DE0890|nr:hypothetical protein [Nocardioides ungokensis]
MTALIRAELFKLRTVQVTAWLLVATLTVVVAGGPRPRARRSSRHRARPAAGSALLAVAVASASAGEIIVMIMGILAMSQELRFGTATSTFLVTPRRGRVVGAKLAALTIAGLVFALVSMVVAVPLSVVLIRAEGGTIIWDGQVADVLVAAVLVMMLYGLLGIAIGALVRNQIAAIAGSLTWVFIIEGALAGLLPDAARWSPAGATGAALQIGTWTGNQDMLTPWWLGLLVLAGWTVLIAVVGTRSALQRDLT